MSLSDLLPFILIGFVAQLVDGALGMAFGVICSTLLINLAGLSPAVASASVHLVATFTSAASGTSHALMRNVDWRMLARLAIPGVIGGIIGAYVIANAVPELARPAVLAYLVCIGLYLLWRGIRHRPRERRPKMVEPLGFAGGFLTAAGGGGWGPVVTSNLLIQGADPRRTIGTVNASEFFLSLTISIAFLFNIGWRDFTAATLGLLIGGICAAPLGALLVGRVRPHILMIMVGIVLTLTSAFGIVRSL